MTATRFVLGNINPGQLRLEFELSVHRLKDSTAQLAESGLELAATLFNACGPYLDDGRNRVVEAATLMEEPWDWLLFVDSDIEFSVQDVIDLLTWAQEDPAARPIVGGTYFSSNGSQFFTVAYRLDRGEPTGPYVAIPIDEVSKMVESGEDEPMLVDALGTGFMAIHRSVIDEMPKVWLRPQPWFAELVTALDDGKPVHMGEDLTFCARAQEMGYPIWLHTGVRLVHYKTVGLCFESTLPPSREEVV